MTKRPPRVVVLATGGTIGSVSSPRGAQPGMTVRDLLERATPPNIEIAAAHDLREVLSSALGPADMWEIVATARALISRHRASGAVITHGTATLQETAYLADLTWDLAAPIVFTGAMIPGGESDSDGPRNLADAIRVAASETARDLGSLVVAAGEIHAARDVTKVHKSAVTAFASMNFGPLGVVDDGTVIIGHRSLMRRVYQVTQLITAVDLIKAFSGMDDGYVRFALTRGARGIVIECFPGRGGLPPALLPAVADAVARGIPVVLSGSAAGRITSTYGGPAGTRTFVEAGAISAGDLAPVKARLLLMVTLSQPTSDIDVVRREFAAACP